MNADELQRWANLAQIASLMVSLVFGGAALVFSIAAWIWPRPNTFFHWIRPRFIYILFALSLLFLGFSLGFFVRSLLIQRITQDVLVITSRDFLIGAGALVVVALGVIYFIWKRALDDPTKGAERELSPLIGSITTVDLIKQRSEVREGKITPDQFSETVCNAVKHGIVKRQLASDMLKEFGFEVFQADDTFKVRKRRRQS